MSYTEILTKLKNTYSNMLVYKDPRRSKAIAALGVPGYLRDWLIKRFAHEDGSVDLSSIQSYVSEHVPRREDWEILKKRMMNDYQPIRILVKIRVELDVKTGEGLFSLPDFGFPHKRYEAIIDKRLLKEKANDIISNSENWGVAELEWRLYSIEGKQERGVIIMTDFKPFKPYRVDLAYFQEASQEFSPEEWIDVILSAVDYNPQGFLDLNQKITFISRLLPFVEITSSVALSLWPPLK
jgi:ATP-dependent Lon protease